MLIVCQLALVLAYTAFGNPWIGQTLLSSLDSRFTRIDPFAGGAYDAVCVLGGSTFRSPLGRAQLSSGGDRVMLGARLYLTGRTRLLVCTGGDGDDSSPDPADECAEIWRDLKIPAEDIIRVGGSNTIEEIDEIQRIAGEHEWTRVGIVTTGWHMRRAMAYAKSRNLELEPLPAAVSGRSPAWSLRYDTIPQARGFLASQYAIKEILGALLNRIGLH